MPTRCAADAPSYMNKAAFLFEGVKCASVGLSLQGKVALVTGASRGIGAAIAKRFAAEGARVIIVARTLEEGGALKGSLATTAEAIRARGGEAVPLVADLSKGQDVERAGLTALQQCGSVDVLVNNAAWLRFGQMKDQSPGSAELAFKINVIAPFILSKKLIPAMIEKRSGWIVNLSSGASRHPEPAPFDPHDRYVQFHQHVGPTLYGASKAALERMSSGMAAELAPYNIAVNTLTPVEAVASEGAVELADLGGDTHVEPVEAMAEAALALATAPASLISGRRAVSLELLNELRMPIRTLDGAGLLQR